MAALREHAPMAGCHRVAVAPWLAAGAGRASSPDLRTPIHPLPQGDSSSPACRCLLQSWIEEMSTFLKRDPAR